MIENDKKLFAKEANILLTKFGAYQNDFFPNNNDLKILIDTTKRSFSSDMDSLLSYNIDTNDDIITNSNEMDRIFVSICKTFFENVDKIFKSIKVSFKRYTIIDADQTNAPTILMIKDGNALVLNLMRLINLYSEIIKDRVNLLKSSAEKAEHTFNEVRKKYDSSSTKLSEDSDPTMPTPEEAPTSPSEQYAESISSAFDTVGVFIAKGFSVLGTYAGSLFLKMGKGSEEVAYSIKVISDEGFDAFLEDDRCMSCVSSAILYGVVFLIIWSIVKSILKRIGSFLVWIGS